MHIKRLSKGKHHIICNACGREFIGSSKKVRTCSPECKGWLIAEIKAGREPKREKQSNEELTCRICGKPLKGLKMVYCSDPCYQYGRRHNIEFICQWCEKPYMAHKPSSQYCSPECANNAARLTGEEKALSLDVKGYRKTRRWRNLRKQILKRDHYQCQVCFETPDLLHLHVHHIIPLREFWPDNIEASEKESNLVTLCSSCHPRVESGTLECPVPKD